MTFRSALNVMAVVKLKFTTCLVVVILGLTMGSWATDANAQFNVTPPSRSSGSGQNFGSGSPFGSSPSFGQNPSFGQGGNGGFGSSNSPFGNRPGTSSSYTPPTFPSHSTGPNMNTGSGFPGTNYSTEPRGYRSSSNYSNDDSQSQSSRRLRVRGIVRLVIWIVVAILGLGGAGAGAGVYHASNKRSLAERKQRAVNNGPTWSGPGVNQSGKSAGTGRPTYNPQMPDESSYQRTPAQPQNHQLQQSSSVGNNLPPVIRPPQS